MSYIFFVVGCTLSVFLGMLLLLAVGRRLGIRRRAHEAEGAAAGSRIVEGAVLSLLGLLVAFTFSGAAARFDSRRQLIVEEINAIGTAYLRLDLLPPAAQPALRAQFRQYVGAMAAGALTTANTLWLRIERMLIMFLAGAYVANTTLELVDMIGVITLHPSKSNAFALLSSSVAIWVANVLTFALLYWQLDGGGPSARARQVNVTPDWLFPQAATPEYMPPDWRPLFLDYLFLGYTTATAFSPTDALPLTHRAKLLMMLESMISLLTLVIVLARAISVLP